jgi:hypothetical protein
MNRIDLIIDALYKTKLLMDAHGQYPHTLREVDEALAAAHELRALKPVAWVCQRTTSEGDVVDGVWTCDSDEEGAIPVYALEVTK